MRPAFDHIVGSLPHSPCDALLLHTPSPLPRFRRAFWRRDAWHQRRFGRSPDCLTAPALSGVMQHAGPLQALRHSHTNCFVRRCVPSVEPTGRSGSYHQEWRLKYHGRAAGSRPLPWPFASVECGLVATLHPHPALAPWITAQVLALATKTIPSWHGCPESCRLAQPSASSVSWPCPIMCILLNVTDCCWTSHTQRAMHA